MQLDKKREKKCDMMREKCNCGELAEVMHKLHGLIEEALERQTQLEGLFEHHSGLSNEESRWEMTTDDGSSVLNGGNLASPASSSRASKKIRRKKTVQSDF